MISQIKTKINNITTTPLIYYILLLILSGYLLLKTNNATQYGTMYNTLENLGLGILGSTLTAFLLDIGLTRKQFLADRREFLYYSRHLKYDMLVLLKIRDEFGGILDKNYYELEYVEWILKVPKASYKSGFEETVFNVELEYCLKDIYYHAKELDMKTSALIGNRDLPEFYVEKMNDLIQALDLLMNPKYSNSNYEKYELIALVIKALVQVFPDFKGAFFEKWGSEKLINSLKGISFRL